MTETQINIALKTPFIINFKVGFQSLKNIKIFIKIVFEQKFIL